MALGISIRATRVIPFFVGVLFTTNGTAGGRGELNFKPSSNARRYAFSSRAKTPPPGTKVSTRGIDETQQRASLLHSGCVQGSGDSNELG